MQNILLVENDNLLAKIIQTHLKNRNHNCVTVPSLEKGYDLLEHKRYDLCILDRVLDDGDGLELAQYINDVQFKTKIIILSKKSELKERLMGLEEGADEYLAKPFNISELSLKVEKLLAKQKIKNAYSSTHAGITLYPTSGEIVINGEKRIMRKKEIEILDCFFRYKNQVVSRDLLINEVWNETNNIPTHTPVDVYIRRIRMFLGKDVNIIRTVRGFGYTVSD